MTVSSVPFHIVTAFTSSPLGGNPAAIVTIDGDALPDDIFTKIAVTINQPMIVFVSSTSLPSDDDKILKLSVRFFSPTGREVPICGHGTLAAGKVLFDRPEVISKGVHTIHLRTRSNHTLGIKKLDGGFFQIQLPSTIPGIVSDEKKTELKSFVDRALGRDVKIVDIRHGGETYPEYVMVELDASENLEASTIDAKQLLGNGYIVNILTTVSPNAGEAFVSRMFAPSAITGSGEDPVCGSAHAVMSPYWFKKKAIDPGTEIKTKQVSPRGGDLKVIWEEADNTVKLAGQCAVLISGTLQI